MAIDVDALNDLPRRLVTGPGPRSVPEERSW